VRKKLIALVSVTLLVFAACGGDSADVVTTPETTAAEPPDTTTTTTTTGAVTSTAPVETTEATVVEFEFTGDVIDTYVQNAGDFAGTEAADWDNAEVVQIELSEMSFTPNNLTFEASKPYVVELVNVGQVKHEVAAEHFFASVAWRKVESEQSEIKAPYFKEIEVFPGQTVELFFVPISTGTFDVVCEIEGHLEAGMFGSIEVVGTPPTSPAPILAPIAEGPWVANGAELVSAADWDTSVHQLRRRQARGDRRGAVRHHCLAQGRRRIRGVQGANTGRGRDLCRGPDRGLPHPAGSRDLRPRM
jgi:uncharacterized cupredoxin-like copper-binding protein